MPKIALIKFHEKSYHRRDWDEDDVYTKIAERVTDWTEVSEDDLKCLKNAQYSYGFVVIERPDDEPKFIADTVEAYLKKIKKEEQRRKTEKEKYEARKAAMALKRKQNQYEKLKKEFEEKK